MLGLLRHHSRSGANSPAGRSRWPDGNARIIAKVAVRHAEPIVRSVLDMPDLVAVDWDKAGDMPEIRRAIYVGHESEMPSWGLVGLKYRDIDAVAHYINDLLRPSE